MYQSMYQGRMDPEMMKRLGLEEQVFEALRDARVEVREAAERALSRIAETARADAPELTCLAMIVADGRAR